MTYKLNLFKVDLSKPKAKRIHFIYLKQSLNAFKVDLYEP